MLVSGFHLLRPHSTNSAEPIRFVLTLVAVLLAFVFSSHCAFAQDEIPAPPRELRGMWIATVSNIDWPSQKGLPTERQKKELLTLLDKAKELHLNAIVFQVRPACDALYRSNLEPWSEYLTGVQGQAPEGDFDPLQFAVEECHKRGLELHAWFNPYRAAMEGFGQLAPNHVFNKMPDKVHKYGSFLWMDPGEKEVQDHSAAVIMDVARRYDIDAVHFDDYFYPYKAKKANGQIIGFPDDASYARYRAEGGTLTRENWRRHNVDSFVQRIHTELKTLQKPVRFGISPFGIWRPNNPPGVAGLDAYNELYADARKWLQEGWVDYLAPQLYWPTTSAQQPYAALLNWWCQQNPKQRHVWVGNFVSKVGDGNTWTAEEILKQVQATRRQPGASGNIHFSAKAILADKGGVAQSLATGAYNGPALVPPTTWIDATAPMPPKAEATHDTAGNLLISWQPLTRDDTFLYAVYAQVDGSWRMDVLPAHARGYTLNATSGPLPTRIAISAVDRCGNESSRALVRTSTGVAAR